MVLRANVFLGQRHLVVVMALSYVNLVLRAIVILASGKNLRQIVLFGQRHLVVVMVKCHGNVRSRMTSSYVRYDVEANAHMQTIFRSIHHTGSMKMNH